MRKSLALVAALAVLPLVGAGEPPEHKPGNQQLHDTMEQMKDALKATGGILKDPEAPLDDALKYVTQLEAAVVESKSMTPARVARLDQPERDIELREYQRTQAKVLGELVNLELALLDGDREAAAGVINGPLRELRQQGHERFKDPEEERGGRRGPRGEGGPRGPGGPGERGEHDDG
ncbi:MAG: cytochrome b562 [Phycisphaerales bacterium]